MTTALAVDRPPLLAARSLISLAYQHEHPLQTYELDDTVERWTGTARIDADILAEDVPARGDTGQERLGAIKDVPVGCMSVLTVRLLGPDNPLHAMAS
ncbi:hypothetical protein ACMZ5F_27750 [Streptomyces rhizosphaericola]|uniref:hypothetical protein n=1 Tax=Streptomyces rhizosphaericola TaxID=2564098 RepID=UPI0036BC17E4